MEIGTPQDRQERITYLGEREQQFKKSMRPGTLKGVSNAIQEAIAVRRLQNRAVRQLWLDHTNDDGGFMM